MTTTERDCWELQKLADWLVRIEPAALVEHLGDIQKARNTLDMIIGRIRKVERHAA